MSWLAATVLAAGLVLGTYAPEALAKKETLPFDVADVLAELNNTDGDLGFHALIDGGPWRYMKMQDPKGRTILSIGVRGRLRQQGMTENFFESAEPTFDELTPEEFFLRFPEGPYRITGRAIDGNKLESIDEFTHLMPAPPENIDVSGTSIDPDAVDCDVGAPGVSTPVIISWDPVTLSHPDLGRMNEPIEVEKYILVVEGPDDLVHAVDLPPDVTSFEVPAEFIDLDTEFKFEILVREASGNQTAVESCFEIS